jgi:hypothetical protein
MKPQIKYKAGYKYQLWETASVKLPFEAPLIDVEHEFITIAPSGMLIAEQGYAWDGPSGPTIDSPSSMRGSLFHDCGYQLMRDGLLDRAAFRPLFDVLLRDICIEDGMWKIRAYAWYAMVRKFAESASHARPNEVIIAP